MRAKIIPISFYLTLTLVLANCTPSNLPQPSGTDEDPCNSCIDPDDFDTSQKIFCGPLDNQVEFVLIEKDVTFLPESVSGYDPRVAPDTCYDQPSPDGINPGGNLVNWVYSGAGYCSRGGSRGEEVGDFEIRFELLEAPEDPNRLDANDRLNIYGRPDVLLPDFIKCGNNSSASSANLAQSQTQDLDGGKLTLAPQVPLFISGSPGYGAMALPDPPPYFINYNDKAWIFHRNISSDRNTELATSPPPEAGDPEKVNVAGTDLEVYYNLIQGVNTFDVIFLIEPGTLPGPDPDPLPFLEYHLSTETDVTGGGLKLESFNPIACTGYGWWYCWVVLGKPVIYLYPEEPTNLVIKLDPLGQISKSDPPYNPITGWQVTAFPNGAICSNSTTYPYLYYEANLYDYQAPEVGFVVEPKKIESFFDEVLSRLGLIDHEIKDFKDYWLAKLEEKGSPYFFITFLPQEEIERIDQITLSQEPDTEIRITAFFRGLEKPIEVEPLQFPKEPPQRKGFVMVEWGGILE
jgi:hypothetical protein